MCKMYFSLLQANESLFFMMEQMKIFLDHVETSWTNLLPNVDLWLWSFSPLASKNDLTKAMSERNHQLLLIQWQALDCALILSGLITLNYFNDYFSSKMHQNSLSFNQPKL